MAVSKRKRFEVFKRDSFTCQYCGQSAPQVVLNCDHIEPKANGGKDEIINLITSCFACNAGKSDKRLADDSAVTKQKAQLDELQERRSQLEMMMQWRMGLCDLVDQDTESVAEYFERSFNATINDTGRPKIAKLVKKFTSNKVIEAIDRAVEVYDDPEIAFGKLGGICTVMKRSETDPDYPTIQRTGAILRKRNLHVDYKRLDKALREAIAVRIGLDSLFRFAREVPNWTAFISELDRYVASQQAEKQPSGA